MAVLWWGARLVIDSRLSVGQLSSFVVYSIFVSGNVGQLAGVFTSLIQVPTPPRLPYLLQRLPRAAVDLAAADFIESGTMISVSE